MRQVTKNVMLASADQVAIDAVAAAMMGFEPMSIEYIRLAHEQGLGADTIVSRARWIALVAVLTAAVRYFSRTLVFNAAREIEYEIRDDIFHLRWDRWQTHGHDKGP